MSNETPAGPQPLVTPLVSITEQVGEHVLQSLRTESCVAVLSTMVPGVGPGADRVVSLPLTGLQMAHVENLLQELQTQTAEEVEAACIGFQCQIPEEKKD